MRKLLILTAATCAAAATSFAQAPASGKTSTTWNCSAPSPMHSVPVAGDASHAYAVSSVKCTAGRGEIAGVKEVDGTATEFTEVMGDKVKGHGIFVENVANGDKLTFTYEFTGTTKDKLFQTGSNKWMLTSGTGKFKGATASGTCTARGNADGTAIFDCAGTYALAK